MKKADRKEVPEVTMEQLAKALTEAGIKLFSDRVGLPLNQAQRNLEGRTHYVDDKTLASFVAKIHGVHVLEEGLLLGIIESVQKGPSAASGRVYRPVFFDVFGNEVARPSLEDSAPDLKKANAMFWQMADDIDIVESTLEGIETKRDNLQKEAGRYEALLEELK